MKKPQGSAVITGFEPIYHSLNALQRAVQAFEAVAFDLPEEDPRQALFQLLSDNISSQLIGHQNTLYGSLSVVEPSKPHAA